jgi:pyrimidine-nucleoside phosphorylase
MLGDDGAGGEREERRMSGAIRMVDVIDRKRRGEALTEGEIAAVVADFTAGRIPDYQMAALLMAIVCRGMSAAETTALTLAMARSGELLDLSDIAPVVADKHSTGGVGDKTTLVVAPVVAACGVHVGKMSGRGLAHTGGTIDKLESIDGFTATLPADRFRALLRAHRLVLAGQSAELAPADGLIYALRDATATVQSIPLIASSIMSKKLAAGATAILLDVKVGRGAFMTTLAEARALAELMVAIGQGAGRRTRAVLSAMDQPLGRAVGNALEVAEAVATLHGQGPADFADLCRHEAGALLALAGAARDAAEGERMAAAAVASGAALATFAACVAAQGGDARQVEQPARLPTAPVVVEVASPRAGWLAGIDALQIGRLAMRLGGGRQRKGDPIDHRVGLVLWAKVGDRLAAGDPLVSVHAARAEDAAALRDDLLAAYAWSDAPVAAPPLLLGEAE